MTDQLVEVSPGLSAGFTPATRMAVRALGRRLTKDHPDCRTISRCGFPIGDPDNLGPGLLLTEDGRMVGGQLTACRSPLRCGWCSPMQWQIAEQIGIEYCRRHEAIGGWIVHSALTVPHLRTDPLAKTTGELFATWNGMRLSRPLNRAKKAVGLVTALSVFQVVWSAAGGWHPHLHVGWLCLGDPDRAELFSAAVAEAWVKKARKVSDRRVSSSRAAFSELVFTSHGFWKYCKPDDPLHPKNDCRHRKHPGCPKCRPPARRRGEVDFGGGPLAAPGPGEPPPFFDDPLDPSGPLDQGGPLEILSQVGPAALGGDRTALATFTEYLTSMSRRRRIPSGFKEAARAYGAVEAPDLWSTPGEGGSRVWFHPRLWADLELGQRSDSVPLVDLVKIAVSDPVGAAAVAEIQLGETVTVVVHEEDGAPIIGRPADLAGLRSASNASRPIQPRSSAMRNTSTTTDARDARAGILRMLIDRLDVEENRKALFEAVLDADSRAKATSAMRGAAEDLHAAVIEFGDAGLIARWEAAIVGQIEAEPGFPGRLIEWALAANDARSGKLVRPRVEPKDDDADDANDGEEVVAAA